MFRVNEERNQHQSGYWNWLGLDMWLDELIGKIHDENIY